MENTGKKRFQKPWASHGEQLEILKGRGLAVPDCKAAMSFLSYINYYRFSGFCLRFQYIDGNGERRFTPGVTFDEIRTLCYIDRDLRDCFSEALELVEISLRSSVAYHFAQSHGAFGHLDPANFAKGFSLKSPSAYEEWHRSLTSETKRSRELFVKHFEESYEEYPDLPIWVASELCSFGTLSKMFKNMLTADKKTIAKEYGVPFFVLDSWLHALTFLRNVCAHHCRLWDKAISITPGLPEGKNWKSVYSCSRTIFVSALIINWMLAHDSIEAKAHSEWKLKLEKVVGTLAEKFPGLLRHTGFPENWTRHPLWWQV